MRINPAVPMAVPHRTVKNTTLNGYEIPQVMFLYILVVFMVSVCVNCKWLEVKISSCGTIQSEAELYIWGIYLLIVLRLGSQDKEANAVSEFNIFWVKPKIISIYEAFIYKFIK